MVVYVRASFQGRTFPSSAEHDRPIPGIQENENARLFVTQESFLCKTFETGPHSFKTVPESQVQGTQQAAVHVVGQYLVTPLKRSEHALIALDAARERGNGQPPFDACFLYLLAQLGLTVWLLLC